MLPNASRDPPIFSPLRAPSARVCFLLLIPRSGQGRTCVARRDVLIVRKGPLSLSIGAQIKLATSRGGPRGVSAARPLLYREGRGLTGPPLGVARIYRLARLSLVIGPHITRAPLKAARVTRRRAPTLWIGRVSEISTRPVLCS